MTTIKHGNHGFSMEFPNGYSLSVQYGYGNYSDNRDQCSFEMKGADVPKASAVEVAIFAPDGAFVRLEDQNDVVGWLPVSALPRFMLAVADGDMSAAVEVVRDTGR